MESTEPNNGERGVKDAVAEQGSELTAAATERAGDLASTVKDQAAEVGRDAVDQGRQLIDTAKARMQEQARTRTVEVGASLQRLGGEVRALADGRPSEAGPLAGYVRDAAAKVEGLADRVEREGFDGIVEDVAAFGRRRPGVFLLSAGVAGFVLGRVIRAGRENRMSDAPAAQDYRPTYQSTPLPAPSAEMRPEPRVAPFESATVR
jgi:hypothetical protein